MRARLACLLLLWAGTGPAVAQATAQPGADPQAQLRAQLAASFRGSGFRIGALDQLDHHALAELYLLTQDGPAVGSQDWLLYRNRIRTVLTNNGYVCDPATTDPFFCRD